MLHAPTSSLQAGARAHCLQYLATLEHSRRLCVRMTRKSSWLSFVWTCSCHMCFGFPHLACVPTFLDLDLVNSHQLMVKTPQWVDVCGWIMVMWPEMRAGKSAWSSLTLYDCDPSLWEENWTCRKMGETGDPHTKQNELVSERPTSITWFLWCGIFELKGHENERGIISDLGGGKREGNKED